MQQQENDFLWNSIRTDYRCPQKKKTRFGLKEKEINDDPAYDIEMSDGFLSKWFEGLRDQYTKLHKRKSGDGSPMFTQRQQWILDNLKFFNRLVTHRSKPVSSFRHAAAENAGDLEAMEAAAALEAIDVDNLSDATGSSSKKRKEKEKTEKDDKEENQRMEKKKKEADDVIATLKATMSEPHTDVTAYAQYIRMTLVRMPRPVFKKARMAINRALEPFLDSSDDSSSNEASVASMPAMKPPSHPSTRPSSAASASATTTSGFSSGAWGTGSGTFSGTGLGSRPTSPCEQPLPHLWKTPPPGHRPDVWGSQSQDFINQQYGSWPQQQQQQQHGKFVQQGWATPYNQQQQQQYHQVQASQSQPLRRTPTPAVSTLIASASTGDILQQATSVLNLSSSQLDTTIGSNFDTSGFLNAMDGSQEKDTSKDTPNDTPKDTSTIDTPPGHKY